MSTRINKARILITGSPGVGKTTTVKKICKILKDEHQINLCGFYTEEVRSGRSRDGFDVVTLDGERGPLARKSDLVPMVARKNSPTVGQYVVDVQSFEHLALKTIENKTASLLVIDEIGKMELFSSTFSQSVSRIFKETDSNIIAVIPVPTKKVMKVVEEIRSRNDVALFEVTKENRDGIVSKIMQQLVTTP